MSSGCMSMGGILQRRGGGSCADAAARRERGGERRAGPRAGASAAERKQSRLTGIRVAPVGSAKWSLRWAVAEFPVFCDRAVATIFQNSSEIHHGCSSAHLVTLSSWLPPLWLPTHMHNDMYMYMLCM